MLKEEKEQHKAWLISNRRMSTIIIITVSLDEWLLSENSQIPDTTSEINLLTT